MLAGKTLKREWQFQSLVFSGSVGIVIDFKYTKQNNWCKQ